MGLRLGDGSGHGEKPAPPMHACICTTSKATHDACMHIYLYIYYTSEATHALPCYFVRGKLTAGSIKIQVLRDACNGRTHVAAREYRKSAESLPATCTQMIHWIYTTHMNYLPKLETCTFSEIVSACKERFGVRDGHHTK